MTRAQVESWPSVKSRARAMTASTMARPTETAQPVRMWARLRALMNSIMERQSKKMPTMLIMELKSLRVEKKLRAERRATPPNRKATSPLNMNMPQCESMYLRLMCDMVSPYWL